MASQPALLGEARTGRPPEATHGSRRSVVRSAPRTAAAALFSEAARPLRFVLVGGVCALLQLALLLALTRLGWPPLGANTAAYLLSAQVNFALSDRFIWRDRRTERSRLGVAQRWLSFHASIAGTFLLNETVFVVARMALPDLIAAVAGIGVAAIVNFVVQDALTFR